LYSFEQKNKLTLSRRPSFIEKKLARAGGTSQTNREERSWQGINGEQLAAELF
jgi:hypothetical protein